MSAKLVTRDRSPKPHPGCKGGSEPAGSDAGATAWKVHGSLTATLPAEASTDAAGAVTVSLTF